MARTLSFLTLSASFAIRATGTIQEFCDQYSKYTPESGQYTFNSNQWGADGSGQQCIQVGDNDTFAAVWQWNDNPMLVHSYPDIALNQSILPLQLSNLTSLDLFMKWSMQPSPINDTVTSSQSNSHDGSSAIDISGLKKLKAKANVALDMFLDADPDKAQSTTAAAYEAMIWLGTIGGAMPFRSGANSRIPQVYALNSTNFTLFIGPNQSKQTVFTWLAATNITSPSTLAGTSPADFSPLLDYLVQQRLLPAETYLGVLQVGSETYHATDKVRFQIEGDFEMSVSAGKPSSGNSGGEGGRKSGADGRRVMGVMWVILVGLVALCLGSVVARERY